MNEPKEPELQWLYQPGRSPVFQAWMDSLESKTVKRVNIYMPNTMVAMPYQNRGGQK